MSGLVADRASVEYLIQALLLQLDGHSQEKSGLNRKRETEMIAERVLAILPTEFLRAEIPASIVDARRSPNRVRFVKPSQVSAVQQRSDKESVLDRSRRLVEQSSLNVSKSLQLSTSHGAQKKHSVRK
eukprot:comp10004_c0_seq1/m.11815 comp10004_c0_seq1/g.11815  ORF comp10004_c0_seq1/g.11815 comp10004_c0_seq1/m.11815 type:complete len:128 (-) comp10004_c0_seq1:100-483(-)